MAQYQTPVHEEAKSAHFLLAGTWPALGPEFSALSGPCTWTGVPSERGPKGLSGHTRQPWWATLDGEPGPVPRVWLNPERASRATVDRPGQEGALRALLQEKGQGSLGGAGLPMRARSARVCWRSPWQPGWTAQLGLDCSAALRCAPLRSRSGQLQGQVQGQVQRQGPVQAQVQGGC